MFGKLLKYEFKSLGKWYFGLYGLTLIVSVILGLMIRQFRNFGSMDSDIASAFAGIFSLSFMFLLSALGISTLVIIIKRFYDNILGRQGYLTMTLPVTTHQILLSKITAGIILSISAGITFFLSMLLLTLVVSGEIGTFLIAMSQIGQYFAEFFSYFGATTILIHLWFLVLAVEFIIHLYLSMSLGHLAQKNRVFLSYVAFFGLIFAVNIISSILIPNSPLSELNYIIIRSEQDALQALGNFNNALIFGIVYYIILAAAKYFGVHYIIKNKLNIQ